MTRMGMVGAGMFLNRYLHAENLMKLPGNNGFLGSNMVAVTQADNYESTFIRDRVEHLFDSLGGISDVVQPGDKVGIKINLTGGSSWVGHENLEGVDIRESVWTHPEVLKAVGELLIDSGVSGNDIYFLEALYDETCYNQYGYLDVQNYLGAQFVDLNLADPYPDFVPRSTGNDYFFYKSFILNGIMSDIDVFVSIPKMKQHYTAGVTHSMKNLVGITPLAFYQKYSQGKVRMKLHNEGGDPAYHLPRSIVDLNLACPLHLSVIDGVKNAIGGEGPWNPTFDPHEDHYLLAGKNSVSTDSVASYIMGNDPEPPQLMRPDGTLCDNHLWLASQVGLGTNLMSEIELVGDGAGTITGIEEDSFGSAVSPIRLYQNHPNPFRGSTKIIYYIENRGHVSLTVYNSSGQEVSRLVNEMISAGEHTAEFTAFGLSAGTYFIKMEAKGISLVKKMKLLR